MEHERTTKVSSQKNKGVCLGGHNDGAYLEGESVTWRVATPPKFPAPAPCDTPDRPDKMYDEYVWTEVCGHGFWRLNTLGVDDCIERLLLNYSYFTEDTNRSQTRGQPL